MAILRRPLALFSAALLVPALGAAALHSAAPHGAARPAVAQTGSSGEFIVRCPATGEVERVDPILASGAGNQAGHYHLFFGNEGTQTGPGGGGTGVESTSTDASMESGNTTCQDGQGHNAGDTAGYWVPLPMFEPTNGYGSKLDGYDAGSSLCATGVYGGTACPLLPGCQRLTKAIGDFSYNCTLDVTDANAGIYIRAYYTTAAPGTSSSSVKEFPDSTTMISGNPEATKPERADDSEPLNFNCGANPNVQTPYSSWPYNCQTTPYTSTNGGNFTSQGLVMILKFPSCWEGTKSWHQPNNPSVKVPGFSTNTNLEPNQPVNDLEYTTGANVCPSHNGVPDTRIPELTERVHFIGLYNVSQSGTGTVDPSSCTQGGANLISSECTTQSAYSSNAPIGLEFSSDSSPPGGAPVPGMFWTAHADYWETWHQGNGDVTGETAKPGTLDDLTEDCLVEGRTCSFVGSPPSNGDYTHNGISDDPTDSGD
jgi:hypothetical protein